MADPKTIYLKDYQAPTYHVESYMLRFYLDAETTRVHSTIQMEKKNPCDEIFLSGQDLNLINLKINGDSLLDTDYSVSKEGLSIHKAPDVLKLEVVTEFSPRENKTLEGLYESSGILCTQNEPEGFRRMTYFFDRPDVMTKYTSYLEADKSVFPYLLSNGNLIDHGDLEKNKHFCTWEDPFPKPTYLFALVAGDLGRIQDQFITMSGREILLEIYCDPGMESQCYHAMDALKKAMKWDEKKFDREYDLDRYMIVAVDSFNMGAMENKGLNIFNSSCVLVDAESATDANFKRVEEVISHEYFHNWTGNRITCRDWFQLTLKEGLTVFRDQEFTADEHDRSVERIAQTRGIQGRQFTEDAGPMSHPIKPAFYIEINNFYSSTVYRKGAEIIRMIHTLIGPDGFKKGMDHYFANYDGQAVTTEDFLKSMEKGGGIDLTHFSKWYHQAGTPKVECRFTYEKDKGEGVLTLSQSLPKTAYDGTCDPMHIPIKVSLYGEKGDLKEHRLLELKSESEAFVFSSLNEKPLLSINENFTAPVRIQYSRSREGLLKLFACEKDPLNKWQTLQEIYKSIFMGVLKGEQDLSLPKEFTEAIKSALKSKDWQQVYLAELMSVPSLSTFFDEQEIIDIDRSIEIHDWLKKELGLELWEACHQVYQSCQSKDPYQFTSKDMGRRALKNQCLAYLCRSEKSEGKAICQKQLDSSDNMTDKLVALSLLTNQDGDDKISLLDTYYKEWKNHSLVVNKWLALHASSKRKDTFHRVLDISKSSAFNYTIPNRIRALHGSFIGNARFFHNADGSGYSWVLEEAAKLDAINPMIASSLLGGFQRIKKVDPKRQAFMVDGLEKFLKNQDVSKDSYEVASKTLSLVK